MTDPHCDHALARRLERAEARSNAEFCTSHGLVDPGLGAAWIEVAGAYAMFDGIDSPCTQTFGLGLFDTVGHDELERLERFFDLRRVSTDHEVCPLAQPELLGLLAERGYRAIEQSNVLFRPIDADVTVAGRRADAPPVRAIVPGEEEVWADVCARGWSDVAPTLGDYLRGLGPIHARSEHMHLFLAEHGEPSAPSAPSAAGALSLFDDVALLAGACTVPEARRQGAQLALLETRLRYAAERGATLAMVVTAPGSGSQRNAERQGFRVAYTRTKWRRERG